MKYVIIAVVENLEPYKKGRDFVEWLKAETATVKQKLNASRVMIYVF